MLEGAHALVNSPSLVCLELWALSFSRLSFTLISLSGKQHNPVTDALNRERNHGERRGSSSLGRVFQDMAMCQVKHLISGLI